MVGAMRWAAGSLYSGGKDGQLKVWTVGSWAAPAKTIDFSGILVRAIDVAGGNAVVGMRDGTIYQIDLTSGSKQAIMESHSDGEVWGLEVVNNDFVLTTADDNRVKVWDVKQKKCVSRGTVSSAQRKVKRGGASTLSTFPDSQCSRAVACNPTNGHVAVGHNDGTLTVRASYQQLDQVIHENTNAKEWIEFMRYSPDGSKLAVGSHDNSIYYYSATDYKLLGKFSKHNSFITSFDWSADGTIMRSVCGAYELLFSSTETFQQDTHGASSTVGTQWATNHVKFGWLVEGIFPPGTPGCHINGVDFSHNGQLIATGDDYGLVNVFRNPCRNGHKPISLRGHSEHVVRVAFSKDDSMLFSVGGYDQTLMQWRKQ